MITECNSKYLSSKSLLLWLSVMYSCNNFILRYVPQFASFVAVPSDFVYNEEKECICNLHFLSDFELPRPLKLSAFYTMLPHSYICAVAKFLVFNYCIHFYAITPDANETLIRRVSV